MCTYHMNLETSQLVRVSDINYTIQSTYTYICKQNLYFRSFFSIVCPFPPLVKWTYHWSSSSAIVVLSTFKDLCKKACAAFVRTYMNFMVIEYLPLDQKWRKCRIIFGSLKPCLLLVAYVRADFFLFHVVYFNCFFDV